jgi:very-long-chain enoyl-CoA reductase
MKLTIASRNPKSKSFPVTLDLAGDAAALTLNDVAKALHAKFPKYTPDRQRITTEDKKALVHDKSLAELGIKDGDTVQFKDLGKHKKTLLGVCNRPFAV